MAERNRAPAGRRGRVLGHLVPGLAAALLVAAGSGASRGWAHPTPSA